MPRTSELAEHLGVVDLRGTTLRDHHHVGAAREERAVLAEDLFDAAFDVVATHGGAHFLGDGDAQAAR